ncbi:hypothetical protein [Synechococcus sp. LA31]|jgi:hypothetical protein|uniref:hypothetical protein n=1 Tax=Synechococcaceae TaxID=1890426 RepID=UPI002027BAA5|nr:hypothetical protein [Synechococcus sp. LA31]
MAMQRAYRLIDACFEPHRQLDDCYASLDDAIGDAVAWLEHTGSEPQQQLIGVEVCAANGDWRTYRLPMPLLCPLPHESNQAASLLVQ